MNDIHIKEWNSYLSLLRVMIGLETTGLVLMDTWGDNVDDGLTVNTLKLTELNDEEATPGVLAEGETGCLTGANVFKSSNILWAVGGLFRQSISITDALPLIGWRYDVPAPSESPTRA